MKLSNMQNSHHAREGEISHRGDELSCGDDRPLDRADATHVRQLSRRSGKSALRPQHGLRWRVRVPGLSITMSPLFLIRSSEPTCSEILVSLELDAMRSLLAN